jgi:protein-S-isoprenylcysteine O-methyltransferase Ste14
MIRPVPFQWPYMLLFWAVFAWAFLPEFRIVGRASRQQTKSDSKSLQVILIGQSLASFAGFFVSPRSGWRIAPSHELLVFIIGLAILIAGSLLRRHCWRMLGSSFTGDVRASADQHVVDHGAYRFLRHPSYTAGIMLNVGVGVALGSWLSVALFALGTYAVYAYRIAVEERTLLAVIGEPYARFCASRKRLIPFIY